MAELFSIQTDRVSLSWRRRGGHPESTLESLVGGTLRVRCLRREAASHLHVKRAGIEQESDTATTLGPRLFEETSYSLYLRALSGSSVELRHKDPLATRDLEHTQGGQVQFGTINFRSQVGHSRFVVHVDGAPELEFETEVFPSKLDYESDYRSMVAEIENLLSGLVLEYLRSTFSIGDFIAPPSPTRLEWLLLLEHVFGNLERALQQVARRPRWGLERTEQLTPLARVRRSDASMRRAIRTGRGSGPYQTLPSGHSAKAQVSETRSQPTLDTPEHRWIAAQLRRVSIRLGELHRTETSRRSRYSREPGERQATTIEKLTVLRRHVARLERLEPIAAATRLPTPGFSSLLLLTSPGYSEAYRALMILQLGLQITGGPLELSLKDLHLLYEYWTYLAVLRICSEESNCPLKPSDLLAVDQHGLQVQLRRGRQQEVRLSLPDERRLDVTYNPRFGDSTSLIPQRPDIVLTLKDRNWPRMRLLLDAKYRLDSSGEYAERFGVAGPPMDAINVLHRYRDAILEDLGPELPEADRATRTVIEGAILFPGSEEYDRYQESPLIEALERLGIGGLPFLPGREVLVREWIRGALRGDSWALAAKSIPAATHIRTTSLQRAEQEWVAFAPPFGGIQATALLSWQRGEARTFAVSGSDPREVQLRALLVSAEATLGARSFRVAQVSLSGVQTASTGQLEAAYVLDGYEEQSVRIGEAFHGDSLDVPRITTRLALIKAHTVPELHLTSMRQWQLIGALLSAGLQYQIKVPVRRVAEVQSALLGSVVVQARGHDIQVEAGSYRVSRHSRVLGRPTSAAAVIALLGMENDGTASLP